MALRRLLTCAISLSATLLLLTSNAHAALFLVFETKSFQPHQYEVPHTGGIGSPGDQVRAHTGGRAAVDAGAVMPAFLATGNFPSTIESPDDLEGVEGLTPIGELRADAKGNGHLSFETPDLDSGEYEIVVYCASCAPTSAGRNVLPVAPFRITGSPGSTDGASTPWITVLLVLSAGIALILIARKRAGVSGVSPGPPDSDS